MPFIVPDEEIDTLQRLARALANALRPEPQRIAIVTGKTEFERSHADLRAALILAGKTIRRLTLRRRDGQALECLKILRRTLRQARAVKSSERIPPR